MCPSLTTFVSLLTLIEDMEDAEKCVCVIPKEEVLKNPEDRCEYGRRAVVDIMINVMAVAIYG